MVIEISIAIIALAFAAFVIYIIAVTKALRVTLEEVNQTLTEVRKQIGEIGIEAKKTSLDLNVKMGSLTSIFNAISNVGDYLEQRTKSLKLEAKICALKHEAEASTLESEAEDSKTKVIDKVANILDLASQSFRLWQDVHKRR